MSSKKGYSLEQVDDSGDGVAVVTPEQTKKDWGTPEDWGDPADTNKKTKTKVSDEEFVEKWMSCDSYYVMACIVDMTISAVQARATRLRKADVKLPSFTRAKRKCKEIDVAGLNTMIEAVEGSEHYEPETNEGTTNE